jgi:hypothetical protein
LSPLNHLHPFVKRVTSTTILYSDLLHVVHCIDPHPLPVLINYLWADRGKGKGSFYYHLDSGLSIIYTALQYNDIIIKVKSNP